LGCQALASKGSYLARLRTDAVGHDLPFAKGSLPASKCSLNRLFL
jgi:hypothetical protein